LRWKPPNKVKSHAEFVVIVIDTREHTPLPFARLPA
jgi:hypothetical protein